MADIRRVLLLASARMPQALEWRKFLAESAGSCQLVTASPPTDAGGETAGIHALGKAGERFPLTPLVWWRARRIVRSGRFDLVIGYYLTSYGVLAASISPRRFVAAAAGSDLSASGLRRIRDAACRFALRRSIGAIAWTPEMAERMLELGADAASLLVSPRGIDLDRFPSRGPASESPACRIITTRRLRPLFRHDRLIEAVARLASRGVRVDLEIVGDGTERAALEALVDRLGVRDRITFPGDLSRDVLGERLRRSDVFVSLSRRDGLSTSLLEALACGTTPVVSDIPANRIVVEHDRNGLVVDADDVETVTAALHRAITDRSLRERARIFNAALARERFDIRRNTRAFLERASHWLDLAHSPAAGARSKAISSR